MEKNIATERTMTSKKMAVQDEIEGLMQKLIDDGKRENEKLKRFQIVRNEYEKIEIDEAAFGVKEHHLINTSRPVE